MLGAVVTPSGQPVNLSVYMKSVCRRRIAIANTYCTEENAVVYRYYSGNTTQPKCRRPKLIKSLHIVTSSDVMQTFCEARTYQNKMTTIRSDNTKSDEMMVVVNFSARVDGKDKQLKR